MKQYLIKEIFGPTIQGEGSMTGTMTHFIRFSGCNMWDGRPETREGSQCPYCDTDFHGGDRLSSKDIIFILNKLGPAKWVTISGGEPLLQLDHELVTDLKREGYKIAIETNGTRECPFEIDHITCSPKVTLDKIKLKRCDDLKLLFPHPFLTPDMFEDINENGCGFFAHKFYLQPVWDDSYDPNLFRTIQEIYRRKGKWSLSIQVHKYLSLR